jgi:preprotein translocase subunit YajC
MYFFFFRPQIKKQKETQKMIEELKKGDKVITQSGIHGSIISIDDKSALLQVDDNTKIRFEKSSIAAKK